LSLAAALGYLTIAWQLKASAAPLRRSKIAFFGYLISCECDAVRRSLVSAFNAATRTFFIERRVKAAVHAKLKQLC